MKQRLIFILKYYLFFLLFFLLSKIIFIVYHKILLIDFSLINILKILWHGLILDLSMSAYLSLLPALFLFLTFFSDKKFIKNTIHIYSFSMIFINVFLFIIDIELYKHWGFHLDASILLYAKTPTEMMASVNLMMFFKQMILFVLLLNSLFLVYYKLFFNVSFQKTNLKDAIVLLLASIFLIIPIRGGFGIAPVKVGHVYFHKEKFVNHSAINVSWNFLYALLKIGKQQKVKFFEEKEAKKIFNDLYPKNLKNNSVLNTSKPNIIFIILESFTAKIIEDLGGEKDVTPNLKILKKEGIFFKNFFASGDRSDKGLVSILSGYPAQPTTSIVKFANKTQNLPFISKYLNEENYKTSFYYGGDIRFANLKSYFINGEFDEIISKDDFPSKFYNSKWGVHDHLVFNRLLKDIKKSQTPFFKVFFTLSSHEPFDVPMKDVFEVKEEKDKFFNSAYYTDKYLGKFILEMKKTKIWDNTLIICLADHGSRLPNNTPSHAVKKFHIPMLWLGGALTKKDTTITTFCSQTDIAKTLLSQININAEEFIFSKNIFGDKVNSFAFYSFNNGFAFINENNQIIFDNVKKDFLLKNGVFFKENEKKGKAYLQILNKDYWKR